MDDIVVLGGMTMDDIVVLGGMTMDDIVLSDGRVHQRVPGGNAHPLSSSRSASADSWPRRPTRPSDG